MNEFLNNHTFKGIAAQFHSLDRYKHIPLDAIDEIVELATSRISPNDKSKPEVIRAYFEHALKCKVLKRYDFTNKEKQLLICSIHFLDLFLDNANKKYKNVLKLHEILTRFATRYYFELEDHLTFAYKEFARVTKEEDVLCNHLVLSTTLGAFFARSAKIDKKLKDKVLNLCNKIHDDVEKTEADTIMYLNSAKVCGDFYKHIELKNNKKG